MTAWAIVPDHLLLALGWTLVHFLWQGALVAALFAIACRAFDRDASGPRYVLAAGALFVMAALPAATFVKLAGEIAGKPATAVAIESPSPAEVAPVVAALPARPASGAAEVTDDSRTNSALQADDASMTIASPSGTVVHSDVNDVRPVFDLEAFGDTAPAAETSLLWLAAGKAGATALRVLGVSIAGGLERGAPLWLPWLVALWGLGVSLLTLRLIGGWVIAQRIKRSVIDGPVDRLQQAVERLGARLGVSRPVRVFRSALVEVPTVIGWLRPVVLVPVGAVTGLTPAQLEALLAHELAHIRRHDYLVNLLQTVVETLLFYHPAVWWVSRRVREEREHCCDDLAVAACGDRIAYARALCELERLRLPAPALAMAASGGSLLHRIRRLLQPAPRVSLVSRCGACLMVIGSLMVVLLGLAPAAMDGHAGASGDGVAATLAAFAAPEAPQAAPAPAAAFRFSLAPEPPAPLPRVPARMEWTPVAPLAPVTAPMPTVAPAPVAAPAPAAAPAVRATGYGVIAALAERARQVERETRRAVRHMMRKDMSVSVTPAVEASVTISTAAQGRAAYRDAVSRIAGLDPDDHVLEAMMQHGVDPTYVRDMTAALDESPDGEELLGLYLTGVTPDFVRALRGSFDESLGAEELMSFGTHGVTLDYVQAMRRAFGEALDSDDLVGLKVHGVTPEYVHTMRHVVDEAIDADDVLGFRVHGIESDYAREVAERMGGRVDPDALLEMRMQNVTPRQLDALKKIGVGPGEEALVELRSHGISLGYVAQMRHFRGHDLTLDQLIALHEHGIEPEAIGAMNVLGYRSLGVDDLVALAENGLTVEAVAQLTSAFGRTLTVNELLELQNNGVNVVYAGNMAHLRGASFSVEDIVAFHQHGVPSAWIAAVLDLDYPHRDVEDLIMLADHGVESRYLAGLKEAGLGAFDPAEVVQIHDSGVSLGCIERAGGRLSPQELIERCDGDGDECTDKK